MSGLAPQWAFSAQAIDGAGDSHLSPGIHLRLLVSQLLGLPIRPFAVSRIALGQGAVNTPGGVRSDITWTDSHGATLAAPFTVSAGNPVTGWLPAPAQGVCCWIEVLASPAVGSTLKVDAVVNTDRGPAAVATAAQPKYRLSASRIERVVVTGNGTVNGVAWVNAINVAKETASIYRLLSLPMTGGQRYGGVATAAADASARVARGAPTRTPLYDAVTAANAMSAPAILNPTAAEASRIATVTPRPAAWLDRLVNDLSKPPDELIETLAVSELAGGTSDVSCLGGLWLAALDAGVNRWLGFGDVDNTPPSNAPGDVIAYVIHGGWQQGLGSIDDPDLFFTLPAAAKLSTVAAMAATLPPGVAMPPQAKAPFWDLHTVACATIASPPARPLVPTLTVSQRHWMPITPPAAQREMFVRASNLMGGAAAALARVDASGTIGLNDRPSSGTLPLVPSAPDDATTPGQGEFFDRNAPATAVGYKLSQRDWFGRWSDWSQVNAPAGQRPEPPRPVLQVFYTPPGPDTFGSPITNAPLAGQIGIQVPVPPIDGLAPGSLLLASLRITVNGAVTVIPILKPSMPPALLNWNLPGPPISRCGSVKVTITARWVDTSSVQSVDSAPIIRTLHDPRPPVPVALDYPLAYGSRPDVTNKSRIDLRWTPVAGQQRFRIFYADETTLVGYAEKAKASNGLTSAEATLLLNEIVNQTAPERAASFKIHIGIFARDAFELLSGDPIEAAPNPVELNFVHRVSGSMRVLNVYRIVSASESSQESDFALAPTLIYAVPNDGPPNAPTIDVVPDAVNPHAVTVTLTVPPGGVAATGYRLRRSSATAIDPHRMLIAQTGSVPPSVNGKPQVATFTDAGASEASANGVLRFWNTYLWRAEVRGGPAIGGGPSGEWSRASGVASLALVPNDPPDPIVKPTIQPGPTPGSWQIVCLCDAPALRGGSLGVYRLDLYRTLPGDIERLRKRFLPDDDPKNGGLDPQGVCTLVDAPDPNSTIAKDTLYRVVVVDPMGRLSTPSEKVTVP